jgi:hypothetical protein
MVVLGYKRCASGAPISCCVIHLLTDPVAIASRASGGKCDVGRGILTPFRRYFGPNFRVAAITGEVQSMSLRELSSACIGGNLDDIILARWLLD